VFEPGKGPALLEMLRPNRGEIYPEDYLKAAGELLFLLFAIVWGMTCVWNRPTIGANAVRDVMGYNNLCIGLDTAPAIYVGFFLALPMVYLCIRYGWTNLERSVLLKEQGLLNNRRYQFSKVTNLAYMVSVCVFAFCFLVSPSRNSYWATVVHFMAFVQLIVVRFFAVWANIYERPQPATSTRAFIWVYGFISLVLPIFAVVNLAHYAGAPTSAANVPLVPPLISMMFDYAWFLCLVLTTKFVPRGRVLLLPHSVGGYQEA